MKPRTSALTRTTIPALDAAQALDPCVRTVIDLRSPAEFAVDHLPGAHNVPLFDDTERALIGTLYAKESPDAAFEVARARTVERIGGLMREIAGATGWDDTGNTPGRLEQLVDRMTAGGIARMEGGLTTAPVDTLEEGTVALHCWRGGLRSRSVVAFLRELGHGSAVCLEGGYKAYRKHVLAQLEGWRAPTSFVLRGYTGVGKSLLLRRLEEVRPGWTLDLEAAAGHRSSILGMVGLEPCSQRMFESRLAARIAAGFPGPCVLEGESRKVGDAIVPPSIWRALERGTNLQLVASVERRVRVLLDDYLVEDFHREELARQLPFIEERLGKNKWKGELVGLLQSGREAELVEVLLERYYDPLYAHSEKGRDYAVRIDANDEDEATRAIVEWIEAWAPSAPAD